MPDFVDLRIPMDAERIRRILTTEHLVKIYDGVMAEPDYVEFEDRDIDEAEEDRKSREWGAER